MTIAVEMISFSAPLPPRYLRSNARSHWHAKSQAKIAYSMQVVLGVAEQNKPMPRKPWAAAKVTYEWCHAGVAPDIANLGANTKALQDFLCVAPDNGLQRNDCYYLGLVQDDKHIEPTYRLRKVAKRKDECVVVIIERTGDEHGRD